MSAITTVLNYATAAGIGTGVAYAGSAIAPDAIKPADDLKGLVATGGAIGGVIAATQVLPRVATSAADRAIDNFAKYDKSITSAIAHKNLPIEAVGGAIAGYIQRSQAVDRAVLAAASNGAAGGLGSIARFGGVAVVGALTGAALVAGIAKGVDHFNG
ncbi:MAG: hypothetical protein JWO69_548 [Thermoleophilia bacterium]|jgi:hypothetical protein|nr:hypothetical protein [Thermoleophilia bacterium]